MFKVTLIVETKEGEQVFNDQGEAYSMLQASLVAEELSARLNEKAILDMPEGAR